MSAFMQRVPLRTKLVAAVLALLAAALIAIGAATTFALRHYLVGRIDNQLVATASSFDTRSVPSGPESAFIPPTSWLVAILDVHDNGQVFPPTLTPARLPAWPTGVRAWDALPSTPFTIRSADGLTDWRLLVTTMSDGERFILGQSLTDVEGAVSRLIAVELIVGAATLVVMTSFGVALIRATLRPLTEMEATAAAIAAGDITRRVPEYEPLDEPPRTEVGTLGRTLNTMLDEIEAAFAARERSEAAARDAAATARTAESAARDAAAYAQRSESRARRSEERMRQFAADASHELRTPLTTIRGFAELYRQGAARTPEDATRIVRRIEDEAARMGMLVEDLLLLARLDQERPLEREPVDLRIIAGDAVVNAKAAAPDRPIAFEIAPNTGSLVVIGDDLRLRQVVGNLMTNALTHTFPDTPVTLTLGEVVRDGARYAELSVTDRGPGLAEDQIERVFERFYRVDTARTRHIASASAVDAPPVAGRPAGRVPGGPPRPGSGTGTGLGLPIVGALVAAHGGNVEVISAPGEGATFQVLLPLAPQTSEDDLSDVAEVDPSPTETVEAAETVEAVETATRSSRTPAKEDVF